MARDCQKRILFISSDKFPPFRVDVAVLFGKELVAKGYKIDFLLQSEEDCSTPYQTTWSGCNVWVGATDNGSSRLQRIKKHILNIKNDFKLFSLTRSEEYCFILVKDKFLSAISAIVAAKITGRKVVYWLSYPFPEAAICRARDGSARYPWFYLMRGYFFKFLLYKIILPSVEHVFVQSEQMKKDIAAEGIPVARMTAVPMGVEIGRIPFSAKEARGSSGQEEKIVLYLGTLARVRKMDFLVRVFAEVVKSVPEAKLYLVGAGDDSLDEQILLDEAGKLGIENSVIMTGFLPMAKAWELVRAADVCVSPFYPTFILNSTSPTKLIEYMAMGKAVVANDHPEQRRVIHESCGGICVPYEEGAFAEAIVDLLENPEKAVEMGVRGRKYVETHRDYSVISDLVARKFEEIISA